MQLSNSSGIVPLSKESGMWKVLLIQHLGYEQYWGCPKGQLEVNETHEEAARRELKEEIRLDIRCFLKKEPIFEEFYWFKQGERLLKRILFYMAEVEGEINLQKEEIVAAKWFSLAEAVEKVVHLEGKETMKQVEKWLRLQDQYFGCQ
ncbi:MAG: NUDIX domain-containing protein [Verrucomicrobia bacterium]|nr:NUDIX domain-containing protein [Verrucomicrobiota bacterium]